MPGCKDALQVEFLGSFFRGPAAHAPPCVHRGKFVQGFGTGRGNGATMADDKENPESGAGEAKPLKIKAEDNPWYLLATLYGVPKVLE